MSDVADAIRDADDETVWHSFGSDLQDTVSERHRDDVTAVVMALTVSTDLFAHDGSLAVTPGLAWAVDEIDETRSRFQDLSGCDAVAVFRKSHPTVDDIRRTVANELDNDGSDD